nr:hypothetical protein [Tanacetum cinerariifolium]
MNPNQEKSSIKEPEHSFSMGYEHFSTTLVTELDEVAESSTKNLVPIPHDVSIEESKVCSNPLFDNDEINSDELESHVESNSVESLSNHDDLIDSSQRIDHLEEILEPLTPIHIVEEERIKREHVEYISRMEMLFTINPRPTMNAKTNVESIPSSLIPVQDNDSQREEIDIVTNTNELLPPGFENDDDSVGEIDDVEELRVDNWPPMVTLGRLSPHARGLEFKPRGGGFPSGAKRSGVYPLRRRFESCILPNWMSL